ncbi:MAG: hypothetical protein O8C61_12410 [Candidatus Methanoperedens sp.]|nr:hypothetical protein [Candidatus Methanoperedens sp.]
MSIIMKTTKRIINKEIDWNALDIGWAEQYDEDYGNLFYGLYDHKISTSAPNIEASILISA